MTPEQWEQIGGLYRAALDLQPDERASFLDEACGVNKHLRQEIESLLVAESDAGDFLDAGAMKDAAKMFAKEKPLMLVGKRLGHYEIRSMLGEGGMGKVYLAYDTKLKRKVALKVLASVDSSDEQSQKRLLREAQAAALLDHPNICAIYEVSEVDEQSYIAMQYIEGETLEARMAAQRLSCNDALNVALQVSDALNEAHTHNVIHCDIKPSNIMLTRRGQVRVLDFGLAKATRTGVFGLDEAKTASVFTTTGLIIGTVPYMSPEQVRGERLDQRTDIFSFGVLLYEMLSGQRAFARDSVAETIAAVLSSEPKELTAEALQLPKEFERIVRKCLAKDRERRYQTTRDLLIDLQNLQGDRTAEALSQERNSAAADTQKLPIHTTGESPIGSRARLAKPRGVWLAALLTTVILAAAVFFYLWQRRGPPASAQPPINSLAVLPLENLSGDTSQDYFADGMTEELNTELAKIGTLRVISRSSTMQYKGTRKSISDIARELNVDAIVQGSVLRSGDKVRINAQLFSASTGQNLWAESYERALGDVLSLQSEVARGIVNEIKIKLTPREQAILSRTRSINPEAQEAYLKGLDYLNQGVNKSALEEKKVLYERSIGYFQQAIKIEPNYAQAYAALAYSYSWMTLSDFPEYYPKCKEAALTAIRLDETNSEAHARLAYIRRSYDHDIASSEKEYKRAIELNPNTSSHFGYAFLLASLGRNDEAIREIKMAEENDPLNLSFKIGVGNIYFSARQYDRAMEQFKSVIESHPDFGAARFALARVYVYKGMHEEALAETKKSLELSKASPATNLDLAWVYAMVGRRSAATKILAEVNQLPRSEAGRQTVKVAIVYAALGDKEQAFVWLEKAFVLHAGGLEYLKTDPYWDDMRSDPRFQDLMRRVGLAP